MLVGLPLLPCSFKRARAAVAASLEWRPVRTQLRLGFGGSSTSISTTWRVPAGFAAGAFPFSAFGAAGCLRERSLLRSGL
eukprot:126586-Pleurochrysis_carterae.AAC.1